MEEKDSLLNNNFLKLLLLAFIFISIIFSIMQTISYIEDCNWSFSVCIDNLKNIEFLPILIIFAIPLILVVIGLVLFFFGYKNIDSAMKKLEDLTQEVTKKNKLSIIKLILLFIAFVEISIFWMLPDCFLKLEMLECLSNKPVNQISAVIIFPLWFISIPLGFKISKKFNFNLGATYILTMILTITLGISFIGIIKKMDLIWLLYFFGIMAVVGIFLAMVIIEQEKNKKQ